MIQIRIHVNYYKAFPSIIQFFTSSAIIMKIRINSLLSHLAHLANCTRGDQLQELLLICLKERLSIKS